MKRLILVLPIWILGLTLVFLNERAASWYDRYFHREEVSLSRASELLKEGKGEDYEDALKNVLMAEDGSEKFHALALYNLGCSSLDKAKLGDQAALKDAFFYFKEALRNDPSLFPAKYNLELLMRTAGSKNMGKEGMRPSKQREEEKSEERPTRKVPTPEPSHLGDKP